SERTGLRPPQCERNELILGFRLEGEERAERASIRFTELRFGFNEP
ncbi:hypothetical protein A2U01_0059508, partial [Trifolium medium]|nr:hypothetical protein [Trifolium medium]